MAPCVHCVEHDDIEAKQQIRLRTNNDSVTKNDIYVTTTISTRIHDTIEEFESAEATLHGAPWPGNSNDAVHDLSDYSPNPVIPFNDADNEAKEEVKEQVDTTCEFGTKQGTVLVHNSDDDSTYSMEDSIESESSHSSPAQDKPVHKHHTTDLMLVACSLQMEQHEQSVCDTDSCSGDDNVVFVSDEDDEMVITDINDDVEQTQKGPSRLLLQKYKSKKEMLDDELIEMLLAMDVADDVAKTLGDRRAYDIPTHDEDEVAYFHLERDLRKIKYAFKDIKRSEPRKHAKLDILKQYKILNAIYTRYCKIGRDPNWLDLDGYVSLLRDLCIISTGGAQNRLYFDIFDEIHHAKKRGKKDKNGLTGLYGSQSFYDKDPWTGIWCNYKDKERIFKMEDKRQKMPLKQRYGRSMSIKEKSEMYYEKYKFRKIGERRIIGCMNNIDYAEFGGTFAQSNYKKAKMEIKFKKRRIKVHDQRRLWFCELTPPQSLVDDIIMKIKWEEINVRSYKNKEGKLKLYKHGDLADDDADIPVPVLTGLSRSQFFDAMLCCAKIWDEQQHELIRDLYLCFDDFVSIMDDYIYKNHCELSKYLFGKEIQDDVKDKLKTHNTVLIKLFKKYASLDPNEDATKHTEEMDCDEWTAMAVELCKVAKLWDQDIWKMGGKPSIEEMIQCFTLSLDEDELLNRKEMSFGEFQRCLVVFTNCIFKYHPNAKYNIIGFTDKLDLVLKWCETLES
eukprot:476623_1